MRRIAILVLLTVLFAACKRDKYDAEKQLQMDEQLIKDFISKNNIPAQRHESGLYYQILEPGTGAVANPQTSQVKVKYVLRLLNGTVIPQKTDPIEFYLSGVIPGWQIGIPLIKPGGKIRLLIPSVYAYGPQVNGNIPANSVLDFDVELLEVKNQ